DRCVTAHESARCLIAHSLASGFIEQLYAAPRTDESSALRDWRREGRTSRDQFPRKERLAPTLRSMPERGRLRQARERDAQENSSRTRGSLRRQHSIKHRDANSRSQVAQRCTPRPGMSTAEPIDTAGEFETGQVMSWENPN